MNARIKVNGTLYEAVNSTPRRIGNWKVKEESDGYSLDTDIQIGSKLFVGQMFFGIRGGNVLVSYQADNFFFDESVFSSEIDIDMDDLRQIMESVAPVIDKVIRDTLKKFFKNYNLSDLLNVCVHNDSTTRSDIRSLVSKGVSKVNDAVEDAIESVEENR